MYGQILGARPDAPGEPIFTKFCMRVRVPDVFLSFEFQKDRDAIVDVLTICGTSAEVDGNTCVEASGLSQKVENAKFLFIAYTVRQILELLQPAGQILQALALAGRYQLFQLASHQ